MHKKINSFLNWICFGIWALICLWFGSLFIKATWQTSNPGSPADSNLYINGTGSLNKDKWNALVDKTQSNLPIWTILAWHKSMSWTPTLPNGFVECNWQTLNDAASVYNWQIIPDLNNSPSWYAGWRFLRWWTSSWVFQEWTSVRHHDWFYNGQLTLNNDWTYAPWSLNYFNALSWPWTSWGSQHYARVRPVNMSVVYIIKIK